MEQLPLGNLESVFTTMKTLLSYHKVLFLFGLWGVNPGQPGQYCKPIPSSADWPSQADWKALNSSVSGRLLHVTPPGAVCHPNQPQYNNASCGILHSQWGNSSFHVTEPVSVDYNDDTCLPSPAAPCKPTGYPAYVIAAMNAEDVQAGVSFARQTGVRLTVKGTGHDYPGRSSGANALSIWTHNIRGIEVDCNDYRVSASGGVATVKIAAGMQVFELLQAGIKNNLTIVTGADHSVGIGGWIGGGGHSPVSSRYGLGADQVLEMEVVTAEGKLRTINEHAQPDLFWAMRGGGASTFAVLISVTVRAYQSLPLTTYLFAYNTTSASDTFWDLAATFHSHLPSLSRSGVMGYYYLMPNDAENPDPATRGKVFGVWLLPEKTQLQTQKIVEPLESAIRTSGWEDDVSIQGFASSHPDFLNWWTQATPETVGSDGRIGSRLLDEQALTGDYAHLRTKLKESMSSNTHVMLGHAVAGPGVRDVRIPGGSNAVNPAFRKAYTHVVIPASWSPLNEAQKMQATNHLRNEQIQALRELAPASGAYVSEADPTEPDWQKTFWGDNYPRLLEVKKKWDPKGVFWCKPCVGHELWTTVGGDGIGQSEARICRA